MDVMIIASRDCTHYRNLARELDDLGVDYKVFYVEDEPELVEKYKIRHSPNLVVDGEVRFRELPTEHELRECLKPG
ncbi:thioredoxin-like protein [Thiogranum longum]|uniref:Thioredoxin-like protein n=1 Tax=Thiogranum longum TaxID=1537524 RepID=A0A4R1HBM1_9GAMM|nr:thioredoxin family protein [Thiogranum longum]TCK18001.1 thioredoxin-like protein [Thiogranum longum]